MLRGASGLPSATGPEFHESIRPPVGRLIDRREIMRSFEFAKLSNFGGVPSKDHENPSG
jgi:hypothetical protein